MNRIFDWTKNARALQERMPEPKTLDQVSLSLKDRFIDCDVKEQFIQSLGFNNSVMYDEDAGKYVVKIENNWRNSEKTSIDGHSLDEWLPKYMNRQDFVIKGQDDKKDYPATMRFAEEMKVADEWFTDWLRVNPDMAEPILNEYNRLHNNWAPRDYVAFGKSLQIPDKHPDWQFRENQLESVAQSLTLGATCNAHSVGAGKTATNALLMYMLKQQGRAKKPMAVVPLKVIKKTVKEIKQGGRGLPPIFPDMKVLDCTEYKFSKALAMIAYNEWDLVLIPDTWFKRIDLTPERETAYIQEELRLLHLSEWKQKEKKGEKFSAKEFVKKREQLEYRLAQLRNYVRRSDIYFEELGVDAVSLDEAQSVKNLSTGTLASKMGIGGSVSQVALDFNAKCEYIRETSNGHGVYLFTATPVSNSILEIYSLIKNLAPEEWTDRRIYTADDFVDFFADSSATIGIKPDGTVGEVRKVSRFKNLGALQSLFEKYVDYRPFIDFVRVPKVQEVRMSVEMTDVQRGYYADLLERLKNMPSDPAIDNVLNVITDGRKASISESLFTGEIPNLENSPKIAKCIETVKAIYDGIPEANQIIFLDTHGQTILKSKNLHRFIQDELDKAGIPKNEIVIINGNENSNVDKKLEIQDKFNDGDYRVIIGSSSSIGAGMNLQEKTIAAHNLDIPWTPTDIEQRAGRMKRPDNMYHECVNFNYFTRGSFDAFSASIVSHKANWQEELLIHAQDECDNRNTDNWNINVVMAEIIENPVEKEKVLYSNEVFKARHEIKSHKTTVKKAEAKIKTIESLITEREEKITEYQANIDADNKVKFSEAGIKRNNETIEKLKSELEKQVAHFETSEAYLKQAQENFKKLEDGYEQRLEEASKREFKAPPQVDIAALIEELKVKNAATYETIVVIEETSSEELPKDSEEPSTKSPKQLEFEDCFILELVEITKPVSKKVIEGQLSLF